MRAIGMAGRVLLLAWAVAGWPGRGKAQYYAATNGGHVFPYTSWETAATNIQAAVTAATAGATVWLSNGVYAAAASNSTVVTINNKPLTLRGASGNPADVVIDGAGTNRGLYATLNTTGLLHIAHLTVTNGNTLQLGAGMCFETLSVYAGTILVENCVLANNACRTGNAWYGGGGLYARTAAGSDVLTAVTNCAIVANTAHRQGGGGVQAIYGRLRMDNCRVAHNYQMHGASSGGGIGMTAPAAGSVIRRCTIVSNWCAAGGGGDYGGGVSVDRLDLMEDCVIRGNTASYGGGAVVSGNVRTNVIRNCLIAENVAVAYGGGVLVGSAFLDLENCTVASNQVPPPGYSYATGGMQFNAGSTNRVRNTIVYHNYGAGGSRSNLYAAAGALVSWDYGCAAPAVSGTGNRSDAPRFVDLAGGDYRLAADSPCINAGTNAPWMADARDAGGRSRLDRFSRIVDMGAFEFVPAGTLLGAR